VHDGYGRACRRSSSGKIVVHRAARRQILGQRRPLAAGAENIHQPIDDLAHHHRSLVAATLGARDQWANQRPFVVGEIAGVTQFAAVITNTVLIRPHRAAPANRTAAIESHVIPMIQAVLGWTLSAFDNSNINHKSTDEFYLRWITFKNHAKLANIECQKYSCL